MDLNSSTHIPKSRRFNLGSPSCATPPRFLSPTLLPTIEDAPPEADPLMLPSAPVNGTLTKLPQMDADTSSTSSSSASDDESRTRTINRSGKAYDSGDEDEDMDDDDREAYLEEIRETNYKRGIPGTPPRYVREKLKADADRERKEAQESARIAAEQAAIDTVKQEPLDDTMEDVLLHPPPQTPPRKVISLAEIYPLPGRTPPYLRDPSPFLMSLEEEEAFYYNIDENLHGDIPSVPEPLSTSPNSKPESDPRNPMSVYCWLRKYQPQVFLQEGEGEKKPRGRGGRKKAGGHEGESGDEGLVPVKAATGKRRRGDDEGEVSRGRGGGRGRGGRRKEGEPVVKKQRRLVARNS